MTDLDDDLVAAAMRACDAHGDGPAARAQMLADLRAVPAHLHGELLLQLRTTYPAPAPAVDAELAPFSSTQWVESQSFGPNASWRAADEVYLSHHMQCVRCQGAGQGRGDRCADGAALWSAYALASGGHA